jgi:glycosyltransferase involved in cell wall biosynthesis
MRILYVVHEFFPHFYAGTERYVLNIAEQMQRMGHTVTVLTYGIAEPIEVFTADPSGIFIYNYSYNGIPVISIKHRQIPNDMGFMLNYNNVGSALDAIKRILRNRIFDIMHIAHPMRLGESYKVAKALGIPVILTLTDFWLLCPRGRFYKPDYSLCNSPEEGKKCIKECEFKDSILQQYKEAKALFDSVDALISPSKFLMDIFKDKGWDTKKIHHIPHGVDYKYINKFRNKKIISRNIVFGYTGVIAKFKGIDLLIKAFSAVPSSKISLKIYGNIVYDPFFNKEFIQMVHEDERIHLMGAYSHDELPRIMSGIDIVVVPSTTIDCYPLVVLEALAYEVPVIASDIVGSAYESIRHGENGMIFPIQNKSELKEIIREISKNPSLVKSMKSHIISPARIEEEAFFIEKTYKTVQAKSMSGKKRISNK